MTLSEIRKDLKAKNLGKRRQVNGRPVIAAIVLHDTAGSGTHNDTRYLQNPGDGRSVSVDFTVERDGAIYQLNPDLDKFCTFHAGRATLLKTSAGVFRNGVVNTVVIGIELVQKANLSLSPVWPTVQVEAVAELCLDLCRRYGLDKSAITTHQKIITDGSRSDPRGFPFDVFWNRFNWTAINAESEPTADDLHEPQTYTVQAGDSLWKIAKQFNTTIEDLKALNNRGVSNIIHPGEVLEVTR